MKKALIVVEAFDNREVGHLEYIGEAADVDKRTGHLYNKMVKIEVEDGIDSNYASAVLVPLKEAEYSNGVDSFAEQPLIDGEPDPEYLFVTAVPEHYEVVEDTVLKNETERGAKLNDLRILREVHLKKVDNLVNSIVLGDTTITAAQVKTYRQSLKDVTTPYKDGNGKAKAEVDSLDVDGFVFPDEPVEA